MVCSEPEPAASSGVTKPTSMRGSTNGCITKDMAIALRLTAKLRVRANTEAPL
jgi:hypothetical protein